MTNLELMEAAIAQAGKGLSEGGIPIGLALARNGKLLAVGHNKRFQHDDPVTHAEIGCLRNAGRIGSFRDTVLYSTLMPCYLCSGAVVQFGFSKVIVGERRTFPGASEFMRSHGGEVVDLDLPECIEMMRQFMLPIRSSGTRTLGVGGARARSMGPPIRLI